MNLDDSEVCLNCGTPLLILGRYKAISLLSSSLGGRISEVFEVVDESNCPKILKTLLPIDAKHIQLFEREWKALQLLNHPAIPKVGLDEVFKLNFNDFSLHCFFMTKFEGQPLDVLISSSGPISQSTALLWFRQLIDIFSYLHQHGFIHRDIKPSNIICKPDNSLALIDFGAVRQVSPTYLLKLGIGDDLHDTERTRIWSLGYSPDEQFQGMAVPQSDFFALGRTFVFLLTGKNPQDLGDVLADKAWFPLAPQVQRPFKSLIRWLIRPLASQRPHSAKQVIHFFDHRLPALLTFDRIVSSRFFRVLGLVLLGLILWSGYLSVQSWRANHYFALARHFQSQGQLTTAKVHFQRGLSLAPLNVSASNDLAFVCYQLSDLNCSIHSLEQLVSAKVADSASFINLASYYEDNQDFFRAEHIYDLALHRSSGFERVLILNNRSRLFNLQQRFALGARDAHSALSLLDSGDYASQGTPLKAIVLKNLGWAALGQGRLSDASSFLSQSVLVDSSKPDAYCLLGKTFYALNNVPGERDAWKNCLLLLGDRPEVLLWKNQAFSRLGFDTP